MIFTKSKRLLLITFAILSFLSSVESLQHLSTVQIGKWKVIKNTKAYTIHPSSLTLRRYSTLVLEQRKGKSFDNDTPQESSNEKFNEQKHQKNNQSIPEEIFLHAHLYPSYPLSFHANQEQRTLSA